MEHTHSSSACREVRMVLMVAAVWLLGSPYTAGPER